MIDTESLRLDRRSLIVPNMEHRWSHAAHPIYPERRVVLRDGKAVGYVSNVRGANRPADWQWHTYDAAVGRYDDFGFVETKEQALLTVRQKIGHKAVREVEALRP